MKTKMVLLLVVFLLISAPATAQVELPKKVLTVEEAVQIALKNNFEVKSSQALYRAAKAESWGAWSGFLPRIDASGGVRRFSQDISRFRLNQLLVSRKLYSLGLSIDQTIFDGGYNWSNYNAKRAGKRSAEENYRLTQQQVTLTVKQNIFDLLKTQQLLEVQNEVVKRSQEQLNIAKARYELGSASLSDYLKAKVQLATENLNLITATNAVKIAQTNLNNTLGWDIPTPVEVNAKLEYQKIELDLDKEMKPSLASHPQIKRAKADYDQSDALVDAARSAHMPSVSVDFSYGWSDLSFPNSTVDIDRYDSWSIGLNVGLNIFSGLSISSSISSAKSRRSSSKELLEQSRRSLELEIRTAYLKVKEAEEKILVAQEATKSAEEDLNLTQEKYNLGAANILELLDSQVSYKTAKTNEVQALFDYNIALAQFEKALGKRIQ